MEGIAKKLPKKYSFLQLQINKDFILDSVPNEFLKSGWKRTILNQNLYPSYRNNKINYQLKGIRVYDPSEDKLKEIELDLYEGILIGYKAQEGQFDLDRIDLDHLKECEFSPSQEDLKYQKLFEGKKSDYLDPLGDGYEIQLSGNNYYVIKDLEDGNYISIDDKGKVYGMFHDPYLIEMINEDVKEFIDQVNTGMFSIDKYYKSKLDRS
ncbi:hypothetical protein [Microcystis sp. M112S1]|uniref:hypothetical protein n=1 Tax=Microcystis sp. M112S1 TaxID=2771103 RepID=UPI00258D03C3|nr:hypothetical protein [Microcystis sp. M112S1]